MSNTQLVPTQSRSAMAALDILLIEGRGVILALMMVLGLGAGLLAGSQSVHAQEQQQQPAATSAETPAAASVNINTADAQALAASLKGVGESRAMDIVRYRETYGPFASAEELTEVKGIGNSTLEKNRNVITLE